jgi:molybdenum cofactor cytidylyltransferase
MVDGIIAIFLAAGKSSRMGINKLALSLGATTVGASALHKAINSKLEHILVVHREDDSLEWLGSEFFQPNVKKRWTAVSCEEADLGQAHSLSCGLRYAIKMKPKGVAVLLADQPYLSEAIIDNLISQYESQLPSEQPISFIASRLQEIARPPIIFSPKTFPEILKLKGDEGARQLFRKQGLLDGIFVDFENSKDFLDIDTKDDYQQVKGGVSHDETRDSGTISCCLDARHSK